MLPESKQLTPSSEIDPEEESSQPQLQEQPFYPLYITSSNLETQKNITISKLKESIKNLSFQKHYFQKVIQGVIITFKEQLDRERFLKMDMASLLGGPIQIAVMNTQEEPFRRSILIKDVPWCISNCELQNALKLQGIHFGEVTRMDNCVRVEVLNFCHLERLKQEGLNFYGCTSFACKLMTSQNEDSSSLVQCFKCQGFWHTAGQCKNEVRCVRCGEGHTVEVCTRSKNNPVCCNCGGGHHAAFKFCPFKVALKNSVAVGFQLKKY